jgi:tetratricopeptide (TPR) repeat protein
MSLPRVILFLSLLSPAAASRAEPGQGMAEAWDDLARFRTPSALERFRQAPGTEARLGEALALLSLQPITAGNVARAEELLGGIAAEAGHAFQPEALYALARIAQVHDPEPDAGEAVRRYQRLIDAYPGHRLAQMAEVKRAILRLYALPHPPGADGRDLFADLDERGEGLTDPDAIRDFYWVLSDAAAHFEIAPARRYAYLRKIDATDRTGGNLRGDLLVQLGETARALGHAREARDYDRRFLEEFPRNERAHWITQRLRDMEESP